MVTAVQLSAAPGLALRGVSAIGTTRRESASTDAPTARAPDTAARPGPPVARLDLRSQTSVQAIENAPDPPAPQSASPEEGPKTNASSDKVDEQGLTETDRRAIEKLKKRDQEVREHERAHATAGGSIAGSPSFKFTRGPDGKQYAVGGEVSIDTSPVSGNPQATIRKLEQVIRAALAPRNPSGQDRAVASAAGAGIIQAKRELAEQRSEEQAERGQAQSGSSTSAAIGQTDPVFDPSKRFSNPFGGASQPLGTGLAGGGELKTTVGLTTPGSLFSLVA